MKSALTATVAVALGLASLPAVSATITLTPVSGNVDQSALSPCIFANDSCQQGTWIGTDLPNGGNVSGYNEYSPVYTGAQITGVIGSGNPLQIGLNINEAEFCADLDAVRDAGERRRGRYVLLCRDG